MLILSVFIEKARDAFASEYALLPTTGIKRRPQELGYEVTMDGECIKTIPMASYDGSRYTVSMSGFGESGAINDSSLTVQFQGYVSSGHISQTNLFFSEWDTSAIPHSALIKSIDWKYYMSSGANITVHSVNGVKPSETLTTGFSILGKPLYASDSLGNSGWNTVRLNAQAMQDFEQSLGDQWFGFTALANSSSLLSTRLSPEKHQLMVTYIPNQANMGDTYYYSCESAALITPGVSLVPLYQPSKPIQTENVSYQLVLLTRPMADVTVAISVSDISASRQMLLRTVSAAGESISISPATVTFTPDDWNIPKDITITLHDRETLKTYRIMHTVSSIDEWYNNYMIDSLVLKIGKEKFFSASILPAVSETPEKQHVGSPLPYYYYDNQKGDSLQRSVTEKEVRIDNLLYLSFCAGIIVCIIVIFLLFRKRYNE